MIYARSRRRQVRIAAVGIAAAVACALTAGADLLEGGPGALAFIALAAGLAALAAIAWAVNLLRTWPAARLCFFRDRLLVLHSHRELTAAWADIEIVSLGDPGSWHRRPGAARLGDRLTLITEPPGEPIVFRPSDFGLEPVACRDSVIRLRDDPAARLRLPEFDSFLDVDRRPVLVGDADRPML